MLARPNGRVIQYCAFPFAPPPVGKVYKFIRKLNGQTHADIEWEGEIARNNNDWHSHQLAIYFYSIFDRYGI